MADNQAFGELAAQDRYDPIVPVPDVLPRSTQVLGGLADLGSNTVDPVVLPQNPNPLADNPFSHYVAQKLFGLGQNAVSALSVPGDVWKGNLDPTSDEGMDRAIGLAQMITEAPRGGGAGPGTVLGSGIRAYHGSPYDFDRFDMSKIGTGEGAQAYGHGLYFAEAEPVARQYRDVLTRRPVNDAEISPTVTGNALFDMAEKSGDLINGKIPFGPSRSLLTRDQIVSGFEQGRFSPHDLSAAVQRQIVDHIKSPGRMYEVNINAHPDEFLDWDKPLAGQSYVTDRVPDIVEAAKKEAYNRALSATHQDRSDQLWGMVKNPLQAPGEFALDALTPRGRGGVRSADTSAMLRDAGIPGIKYLDQGSRGSGTGTSNYVVFNDRLIDILRKYGLAGLTAGAGATAAGQQMDNSVPFGMIGAVPMAGGAMGSLARQDDYQ